MGSGRAAYCGMLESDQSEDPTYMRCSESKPDTGDLSLRRKRQRTLEKTNKDLRSRRRIKREVHLKNKAGENFNLENHSERSKNTLRSRQMED